MGPFNNMYRTHLPWEAGTPGVKNPCISMSLPGVAGGATRAALTQHFALQGNAADVAAREASQETATTLIGELMVMEAGVWFFFFSIYIAIYYSLSIYIYIAPLVSRVC